MKNLIDALTNNGHELHVGDVYYFTRYDTISGEEYKKRPHIILKTVDGYCGGALMMGITAQAKAGSIPIVTNVPKKYISFTKTDDVFLVPYSKLRKILTPDDFACNLSVKFAKGLELVHRVRMFGYVPTEKDREVFEYMNNYIACYNRDKDDFTTAHGSKLPRVDIATLTYVAE